MGNCTLIKNFTKELVKELGKIWNLTCVFHKQYCHDSTEKELVVLGNMRSQASQEDLTQTVWTSRHWGSWHTSPCHVASDAWTV